MSSKILIFMFNLILITHIPVYSKTKGVSLKECIEIALQNHPEIMASLEEQEKAKANYRVAKSKNKVIINGEIKTVEYLKEDAPQSSLNIPGEHSNIGIFAGPTFIYNLIDPKKAKMEDAVRLSIDLSKMHTIRIKNNIVYNVKESYYGYLFALERRSLRESLMKKFEMKLRKAKMLFGNGLRPILDVSKAEVDLADAKLKYEKVKNYVSKMKSELLASMGIVDEDIEVPPIEVKYLPQLRFAFNELYRLAEDYYPEIRIAKLKKQLNKLDISVEQRAHIPRVDILGGFGIENSNIKGKDNFDENFQEDNWKPTIHCGVRATIPIYSGGGIQGKVDAAIAEFNKSKYLEREILINMRALIRSYLQSMNEFKKQIEISKLMIDNAQKHLMLAQKSYENGIASQLDMHDAEMMVLESDLHLLRGRYDYLITLAKLSHVIGLGEEYLCQK